MLIANMAVSISITIDAKILEMDLDTILNYLLKIEILLWITVCTFV